MITLRPARSTDAARIVATRDALATWQDTAGIDQWRPGEVSIDEVHDQIGRGEWFVHEIDATAAALVRVVWSDPTFWDDLVEPDDSCAGYIHGLMVPRSHAGRGFGRDVVGWAERHIADHGRRFARLDCGADNTRLRSYYRSLGYSDRGVRDIAPWGGIARLEHDLAR